MSRTRSAPAARASNTWYSVAMKSLRSTGSATADFDRHEVGEAALEPAALGEDRDRRLRRPARRGRAWWAGSGMRGEVAARGARALDLGDDLDAVGRCERGVARRAQEAARVRPPRRRRAAARRRAPRHPDRAGREVGEHGQCSFGAYFVAVDAVAGLGHAPADESPDEDDAAPRSTRRRGMSRKKKNVPIATPTSMIMTAVHAAGECP